jgi:methionyl-tRNA formyltransferase
MLKQPLRIVFAGTPDFAATSLRALLESEHQVVAVYTQPDRPSGRKLKLKASSVKEVAEAAGVPVCQPLNFKDEIEIDQLASFKADLMVVVAYGLLLPASVLNTPRLGCINVHASLLPRWRGAAPIERALLNGDRETGVTIMQMDEGLDTGAMLRKQSWPITPQETCATLHDHLADLGSRTLLHTLSQLATRTARAEIQIEEQACYAAKLDKREGLIDWQRSAAKLDLQIRGLGSRLAVYTTLNGERLRIWQARPIETAIQKPAGMVIEADKRGILVATGQGALLIQELQLPNAKRMSVSDILNGRKELFTPDTLLGTRDSHL